MNIQDCLEALGSFRKSGNGFIAHCPGPNHAHNDRKSSLSVTEGDDGRILLKCHAGCAFEEICAAMGWKPSDLFSQNGYGNARGKPLVNSPEKGKQKDFRGTASDVERMQCYLAKSAECQCYIESRGVSLKVAADLKWGFVDSWKFRDERTGKWFDKPGLAVPHFVDGKLAGIKFRTIDESKLFSQLPDSRTDGLYAVQLLDHAAEEVLIHEGPEDCALAITYGYNATAINSASSYKLNKSDLELLCRYNRIYLVGDHDISGVKAMNEVGAQLPPEKVIRVPSFGYKDIGELWKADPQNFAEKLHRILRLARASRTYFELDDLLTEDELQLGAPTARYAVEKLVPLNDITMFFSEEKSGKSTITTYMAKCVANKLPVFGKYQTLQMPVLVLDLEANDRDIVDYLQNFKNLGPNKIRYFTRSTGVPALDSPALIEICKRWRPLILIESFTKFASRESDRGEPTDIFHPGDVSRFFDKLLNLCAAGATVVLTHHSTRADAERYADSHQIGAAVARAYAVLSLDRPQLKRVRLECKLARGAEPVSENLIAFPVISQTGHFGLATTADDDDLDRILGFILAQKQKGDRCRRADVKKNVHIKAERVVELIDLALKRNLLTEDSQRFLHCTKPVQEPFPKVGNASSENEPFPEDGNGGNTDGKNVSN